VTAPGAAPDVRETFERVSGSTATVYIFSGGKVIAEYDNGAAPGSPSREYIYSGSQLLATISGGATTYHHPDHLSVRVSTDANGNVTRAFGHFPFGEVWYETGTASKWKFSTYERDTESGNDYAMARFYGSSNARFASPDPIPGSASDPQSLNRYSYAVSDPIDFVDFSGLTCQAVWFGGGVQVMCDPLNGGAAADGGGSPHYAPLLDAPDSGRGNSGSAAANNGFHVQRTFQRTFQCSSSASGVMNALESNFASFANNPASGNFSTFSIFTPGPASPGGQIGIDVGVQVGGHTIGYSDVSVTVQSATSSQLVFQSDPGHVLYPATVSFSASDAGNGSITFTTSVNATTNGLWGTAQFYLLGGRAGETSTWNNLLNNVAGFCAQPSHP